MSQRLFSEQGFAATTLEQICEEVQVVPQTLLRYFDSKHRLALAPQYDSFAEFEQEVRPAARPLDVLSMWRAFAMRRARQAELDPRPLRLVHDTPELRNAEFDVLRRYEDLLTECFATEAGDDEAAALDARLLACTLVGGDHAMYVEWLAAGATGPLTERVKAVVDRAVEAFPRSVTNTGTPASAQP
ncbi:MAG: TetR/AcrR family transcriptional regulator [Acidimicrobiales bacterium]